MAKKGKGDWWGGDALEGRMLEGQVAELCFDLRGSPVNKVSALVLDELEGALRWLEQHSDEVRGLVLTSGKAAFVVGADIDAFESGFARPPAEAVAGLARGQHLFNRLEDLPFPSVAAVNGPALGGGLELAMAASARVAAEGARLGQPEVKLGIIPGWGGTVRLPRLIGLDNALELICGGGEVNAARARALGLVDAVVPGERLLDGALAMLEVLHADGSWQREAARKKAPGLLNATELAMSISVARGLVRRQAGRHYPAPLRAVDLLENTMLLGRAAALDAEVRTVVELGRTPQCRQLVRVFFGDRQVRKLASRAAGETPPLERLGILGAGTMGGGIAYQAAVRGVRAAVKDVREEALQLALTEAGGLLRRRVERGRMTAPQAEQARNAIFPTLNYAELADAQVIIEAVTENADIKCKVLADVEARCPKDAVIATNTSTIPLETLQDSLSRPERFCGLHFFNPVPRMPLVEVIHGPKTAPDTLARAVACAIKLGKVAVVVKSGPGFLVNRVLFPYLFAFQRLVAEGADILAVDQAMEAFGWPMGPAHLCDVVGLDVCAHAGQVMATAFSDRLHTSPTDPVRTLVEAGDLGEKSGRGFYRYTEDSRGRKRKQPDPDVATRLAPAVQGDAAARLAPEEIVSRLMLPMLSEASRCLTEEIIATPVELDLALLYGIGFPPFRGGLLRWAESEGLPALVQNAQRLADSAGNAQSALYAPTEQLRTLVAAGKGFY